MAAWNTLPIEVRALKTANRQWNRLSPEAAREMNMWTLFVHPTARLIKDLDFPISLQPIGFVGFTDQLGCG